MSFDSTIHAKAVQLTRLTYQITAASGSGHPSTGASLAHLVSVLMYKHMRYDPDIPSHPASDRLVLSEGHAVPIIYAACADRGVMFGKTKEQWRAMTVEDAMTLRQIDSLIDGHPNPVEGFPFFDAATGSLGQGLSVTAGIAAAAKLDGLDRRIFCIIGDGESREGQNWEAIDFIQDHQLKAVCPIFNANAYAQSDKVSPQQSADSLAAKLQAAGYEVLLIDGHQPTAIADALAKHATAQQDPKAQLVAIVAKTVKGWGSASQQGNGHHGQPATGDALAQALAELEQTSKEIGATADVALQSELMSPKSQSSRQIQPPPSFADALEKCGMAAALGQGKLATRKAYGVALHALGHANDQVVAMDGDVQASTFASLFANDEQLTPRYLEGRIAEQNILSVAVGLSAAGKIPFCSTFAKFLTRAYDQIEMAVNSGANIKVVGSHAGVSLAADGPSQMGLPDLAWFRAFSTMQQNNGQPGFYILQPSDAYQAYALVMAMAEHDGPCYMRTLRPETEFLYGQDDKFTLGGHEVLSEGRDLLIVAAGYMVHQANEVLEKLDSQGVDATLVDLYSIPFDGDAILDLANENNGMILTLEDNYGGGLGSAVADVVAADGGGFTVNQMHVRRLPKSGLTTNDLMTYCGLSVEDITQQALSMLQLSAT